MKFPLVLGATFAFDVITKMIVRATMPLGAEIPVLPFFSLVHVTNTGIAFGMFQGKNTVFAVVGLVVVVALIVYAVRLYRTEPGTGLIMALVIGGAAGNLLDRAVYGHVTDFLDFYVRGWHWPAFNVADSAICVGAALLLLQSVGGTSRSTSQSQ